jgi:hypothetical protein
MNFSPFFLLLVLDMVTLVVRLAGAFCGMQFRAHSRMTCGTNDGIAVELLSEGNPTIPLSSERVPVFSLLSPADTN